HEVVQAADRITASARQPRIDGRLDAEGRVVLDAGGPVLHDVPVAPCVPMEADGHGETRDNLVLHGHAEAPVVRPRAPATDVARIEGAIEYRPPQVLIVHPLAFAI